jgi:alpha-mannosidase
VSGGTDVTASDDGAGGHTLANGLVAVHVDARGLVDSVRDLHADRSASETQFGHVFRPTHANTPWDAAKFEICAHRWVHVAEPGYGVAVANSATYGHDVQRTVTEDGATVTTVRESLLRAPLFPDPDADQGEHRFLTVLHVGADLGDAVRDGYAANLAPRVVEGAAPVEPLVTVDDAAGAVIVESVKLAEDRSGDVVVRVYEALGGHARATIAAGFETSGVTRTDLLERPLEHDGTAEVNLTEPLALRPFEIVTLRFARA